MHSDSQALEDQHAILVHIRNELETDLSYVEDSLINIRDALFQFKHKKTDQPWLIDVERSRLAHLRREVLDYKKRLEAQMVELEQKEADLPYLIKPKMRMIA